MNYNRRKFLQSAGTLALSSAVFIVKGIILNSR